MQVYLDGVDKGSKSITTNSVSYNATTIGGMLYSSDNYFNGKIDEVSVFDSALSASQVLNIYKGEASGGSGGLNGTPGSLATFNPVGWWRMGDNNGGTGTTITDEGSGGNDATLTNGPTFSSNIPSTPTVSATPTA